MQTKIEIMKYTTDGKCEVLAGKQIIARSHLTPNGYEVRIRQGMPRVQTIRKIVLDCPEFAKANGVTNDYYPYLFS